MTSAQTINEQSIELIERYAHCLLTEYQTQNNLESVKQLAPYVAYFNNEIEMDKKRNQIFKNFVEIIDSAAEKPDCDTILSQFNKEIDRAKMQLKKGEKYNKFINFIKMMSQQNGGDVNDENDDGDDDDEEIRTISETVNTIDPITKLPFVEPVKNKICGHTYEKTSIIQLMKQNSRTRCPIAGCTATAYVKKCDLVPDIAMKRLLNCMNINSQKKLKLNE